MKTRHHDQDVIFDDEKQRVRETAQQGAANILQDDGKLQGINDHPFDQGVDGLAETPA